MAVSGVQTDSEKQRICILLLFLPSSYHLSPGFCVTFLFTPFTLDAPNKMCDPNNSLVVVLHSSYPNILGEISVICSTF